MANKPAQWTCPFCDRDQVLMDANGHVKTLKLEIGPSKFGTVGVKIVGVRCLNPECNDVSITTEFVTVEYASHLGVWKVEDTLETWHLRPESKSKPQPSYIPAVLVEDYNEACLIRDKSPKAAATLARRCLQGMIRDFCGISKNRLIDEINELRTKVEEGNAPRGVDVETVEAIDAVRGIGNIGAHMEKDIDLIIAVDPGEAQALIELIEMLFTDWYVAREKRKVRLASVKAIALEKEAEIAQGRAAAVKVGAVAAPAAPVKTP